MDLLNVKYIFSLTDLNNPKYKKVFQEARIYVMGSKRMVEDMNYEPIFKKHRIIEELTK
jgi:hypothetical protein